MYFEDLSDYRYFRETTEGRLLNVGWLDRRHPFETGTVPRGFQKELESLCKTPVRLSRGYHFCQFCASEGKEIRGNGEIRVIHQDDVVYAAPVMIYHYVSEHGYLPPDEFIRAVENNRADP